MSIRLSDQAEARLEKIRVQYPRPQSAAMYALYIAQEELGCINEQAILWVAERVGLAPVHVRELVTFYTLYRTKPLGRYHVQVCRTLSCAICGARALLEYLHARFKVGPREVTSDGLWSYEQVECLGSCGTAPMCQINDHFFENLNPKKLGELLDRIEKERPDLSLSTVKDELGAGLKQYPKSEVI